METAHRSRDDVIAERAILVGCGTADVSDDPGLALLDELAELAKTAGTTPVARYYQRRPRPDTTWYIGKGKVEEIAAARRELEADAVLFDVELTPRQVRNLEEKVGCKVLDRSEVILDIFATHAKTIEARLQVELAQLRYTQPRLKRMWTHLSRITGQGGIGSRGPGEKQIETDRRIIDRRIHALEQEIEAIHTRKERQVATRRDDLTIALVGYTNAGKSTLMNRLTGAGVYQADRLFATLDTKTATFQLPNGNDAYVSDTVGFIENLPHHLVASFHATMEEVRQAKLLLHVLDAAAPGALERAATVHRVLHDEMGLENRDEIMVLNKVDAVQDPLAFRRIEERFEDSIAVSARTGEGIAELVAAITAFDDRHRRVLDLELDAGDGRTLAELARVGEVLETEWEGGRVRVKVRLPNEVAPIYQRFVRS